MMMGSMKLCLVGGSEDGDRIFCLFKRHNKTLIKGIYDFNVNSFIIKAIFRNKLEEGETERDIIYLLRDFLNVEFDWEIKAIDKVIEIAENGGFKPTRKKH